MRGTKKIRRLSDVPELPGFYDLEKFVTDDGIIVNLVTLNGRPLPRQTRSGMTHEAQQVPVYVMEVLNKKQPVDDFEGVTYRAFEIEMIPRVNPSDLLILILSDGKRVVARVGSKGGFWYVLDSLTGERIDPRRIVALAKKGEK